MVKEKSKNEVIIQGEWCKGCNICVTFCPKDVLVLGREEKAEAIRQDNCIGCRLCEMLCPDLAITVITEDPKQKRQAK